jgi:hypothetical protein
MTQNLLFNAVRETGDNGASQENATSSTGSLCLCVSVSLCLCVSVSLCLCVSVCVMFLCSFLTSTFVLVVCRDFILPQALSIPFPECRK